jgi:hypothetical protein
MTSTHCKSVALGRIIAPWAVKIAEFFGTIVKIILTIVENVRNSLHELGACCREGYRIWSSCGEETAHSPSLPFSRCEAMGEGGRRPDGGSFPKSVAISTSIPAEIKSPHPPFGHPLPSLRTGEGENWKQNARRKFSYAIALLLPGGRVPTLMTLQGCVHLADIGAAPPRITEAALSAPRCRGKAHGFRSA